MELAVSGHSLDGVVAIVGCDKTIPAVAMALARMDIPGLVFYGGSLMPGKLHGACVSIQNVFEAIGAHGAGTHDDAGLKEVEQEACPGAAACPGQFIANIMAMAPSVLDLSPMGVRTTFLPSTRASFITPSALMNAAAAVSASGESTNTVHIQSPGGICASSRAEAPNGAAHVRWYLCWYRR